MRSIQVVIDDDLLAATDDAARQQQINRSALVRDALHAYLARLRTRQREERDREGYALHPDTGPDTGDGLRDWEQVAEWPDP